MRNVVGDEEKQPPEERNILDDSAESHPTEQQTGPGSSGTHRDQDPKPYASDKFETCTEILGFESASSDGDSMIEMESTSPSRSLKRKREDEKEAEEEDVVMRMMDCRTTSEDFPPLLSTLDRFGRPRFVLENVRENGRLQLLVRRNESVPVLRRQTQSAGDLEPTTKLFIHYDRDDDDDNAAFEDQGEGERERETVTR